jgi:hypothetical protein
MSRDTVLVPPHLLKLLTAGHPAEPVLELLKTHVRLERLRSRRAGRTPRSRLTPAPVIPIFTHGDQPDTVLFNLTCYPAAGESDEK